MEKSAGNFFNAEQKQSIANAIRDAEQMTSGEIRVHVENVCNGDVLDRAATLFEKLGMNKTEQRNGVLFYLAIASRKFAILGDVGINSRVPEDFWEKTKEELSFKFSTGEFDAGIVNAIRMAGEQLAKWFPREKDDQNELTDDISYGKN